jgi:hypothetical protein
MTLKSIGVPFTGAIDLQLTPAAAATGLRGSRSAARMIAENIWCPVVMVSVLTVVC